MLGGINGKAATVTKRGVTTIDTAFPGTFKRFLYNVVPWVSGGNHIPSNLQKLLDPAIGKYKKHAGFFCSKGEASTIENYGFLPVTAACGSVV